MTSQVSLASYRPAKKAGNGPGYEAKVSHAPNRMYMKLLLFSVRLQQMLLVFLPVFLPSHVGIQNNPKM